MQVTFFGVRGSIPTPGEEFVRYGGNTACVHIKLDDGTDIILDSGTGIRVLGKQLTRSSTPIHILLSHNHWDHIQGFPFFAPIYQPDRVIHIYPGLTHLPEHDRIITQMEGSAFPVPFSALPSKINLNVVPAEQNQWCIGSATVKRLPMNHPGKGSAYTIEDNGHKVAYITDNELYPPYKKETSFLSFAEFAQNADVLIHDAQYTKTDMPVKSGWGHSVAEEAVKLALASKAKKLALYSHDPERTDDDIDKVVKYCQRVVTVAESTLTVFASAEGQSLDLR
jgi:phosphoribosyl 1,2-cyclic phosphodiesterase